MRVQKTISLGLQKLWETEDGTVTTDMLDDSYSARFKLKRYYHEEYLAIPSADNIELIKITLDLGNENTTELEVPKGSPVYFTADLTPDEDTNIRLDFRRVTQDESSETCSLIYPSDNHYASTDEVVRFVVSDPIDPAPVEDETWIFVPESSSSSDEINKYILGGINGVRLATFDHVNGSSHGNSNDFPYDVTGEIYDTVFNNNEGFELNSGNNWAKNWEKLPQIVELLTTAGGNTYLTSIVYSYYFEEIECNPPEYYAVFRDHNNAEVRYGDELSRIEVSGLTIDAINRPNPETLLYKVDEKDLNQSSIEDYLLSGAQFKVVKYTDDNFREKDNSWGTGGEKDATLIETGTDGKFGVDGLVKGFYQIEETVHPDGYVRTAEKPRFEVALDAQSEKLVIETLPGNDTVRIINNYKNTGDNVIIYGNTPGAALPNTGGSGTNLFYLIGCILTMLAGAGIVKKWRSRELG
jgi:LPXTG-motif cell wall-anchored protein